MKSIGFIGCGKIAPFHAEVLKHLGKKITAVCNHRISDRVLEFQKKYDVDEVYTDWKKMLKQEKLDAVWLITSWDSIEVILKELIQYKVPIFVEKPVALSSIEVKKLIELQNKYGTKIQVGHNRRFYRFMPELKSLIEKDRNKIRSIQIEIPETTGRKDNKNKDYLWIHNSSHVMDLLTYLIGDLTVVDILKTKYSDESYNTFNAFLKTKDEIPVHLIANWNAPSNFGIKFYIDNKIHELKPIEFYSIYDGFDIQEPTLETPIRQYHPRLTHKNYCNATGDDFKPGFLEQAKHFFGLHDGNNRFSPTTFKEVFDTTIVIEKILE